MAFLNKDYKLSSSENLEAFLSAIGMPEDKIKETEQIKPTEKLVKNADGTYSNFASYNGRTRETKFTPGVEFDDVVGEDKIPVKSLITIDGNVVTQVMKTNQGSVTYRKEYNGDELTVFHTSDKFDGVAKIYYKA